MRIKRLISICLLVVLTLSLAACTNNVPQEPNSLYTTHGMYFKTGEQHMLITPSGTPIIFTTDEPMNYADGDKLQFNYKTLNESYPTQTVASNVRLFEDEMPTDNIGKVLKQLHQDLEYQFDETIYASLVPADEPVVEENAIIIDEDDLGEFGVKESIKIDDKTTQDYSAYYIPAGTYKVTNNDDYPVEVLVYHKGTHDENGSEVRNVAKQLSVKLNTLNEANRVTDEAYVDEATIVIEQDDYICVITDETEAHFNIKLILDEEASLPTDEPVQIDKTTANQWTYVAKVMDNLDNTQNLMYSPLSLNFALALISQGASDEIKADFETYFGMSFDDYMKYYADYIAGTTETLEIANAYYLREAADLKFNEEFVKAVQEKFAAEIGVEKFDAAFVEKVNKWCAEKTHDMIPSILNDVPDDSIKALALNALYFKDKWETEYKEENIFEDPQRTFAGFDGEIKDVTYLYSEENTYYENDSAIAFAKPYKNTRYSFIGILPKAEGQFTIESLDIESLLASKTTIETHVLFPEFEFENTLPLTNILNKVGMESIFKGDAFTGIANVPMQVSDILQKTKIKVNREGTEAAAVTEITMENEGIELEPIYKEVVLTRPFMFIIYDNEMNMPLFVGRVLNPKA